MNKYIRKQTVELLRSIGEGVAHAARLPVQSANIVLEDCHFAMDVIAQTLQDHFPREHYETNYAPAVEMMKQLLQALYIALDREGWNAELDGEIAYLQRQFEDELAQDPQVKAEIVFLPYKASMWDSFESIWHAAEQDPQCESYVVAVPYYDRLPDGTFGQMHYEGASYPAYVPVTDWRQYDLGARHPDVIFIHSPYDGGNYVTSIHPDYYSERIHNSTDLLVYVPYFVSMSDVQEHLCVCDGVLYADRVIVQSEQVKASYIHFFEKYEKAHHCEGRFGEPSAKFAALGSPKVDKVIRTEREKLQIPDEWERQLYDGDGKRKKVVFYNTSIEGLLQGNERVLSKLRHVFQCFEKRQDAVLLWRPHPLNEATYRSMRPQLYREYLAVVADYRQREIGIFDDSADMDRAIALSDAYYGEQSSLLTLSLCAGKPAMLQDLNRFQGNEVLFWPSAVTVYQDKIYFASFTGNLLGKYDLSTGKVEQVWTVPGERGKHLYVAAVRAMERIVFVPYLAAKIAVYDTRTGELLFYPFPEASHPYPQEGHFGSGIAFGESVYLLGYCYPGIVRFDPQTGETKRAADLYGMISHRDPRQARFFGAPPCVLNSKIYAVANGMRQGISLVQYDPERNQTAVIPLAAKENQRVCSGVTAAGRYLWISFADSGQVLRYDPLHKKCVSLDLPLHAVHKIDCIEERLYVFRLYSGEPCFCLDKDQTPQPFELPCNNEVLHIARDEKGTVFIFCTENRVVRMWWKNGERHMACETFDWQWNGKFLNAGALAQNMEQACGSGNSGDFLFSESLYSLPDFIESIGALTAFGGRQAQIWRNRFSNPEGTAGEKIYELVCSELQARK